MPRTTTGYKACTHEISYHVSNANFRTERGALIDRGANGGVLGSDAIVTFEHMRRIDVTGIDNHELTHLKVVDATARVMTNKGPIILILQQYAYLGQGATIHSAGQLEWGGNTVYDKSLKVKGGKQCIVTVDGYIIPIDIINGLPYIKMTPNTKAEFEDDSIPHVVLTGSELWEPRVLDNVLSNDPNWTKKIEKAIIDEAEEAANIDGPFDDVGNYTQKESTYQRPYLPPVQENRRRTRSQTRQSGGKGSKVLEEEFIALNADTIGYSEDERRYLVNRVEIQPMSAIKETFANVCDLNAIYSVNKQDLTDHIAETSNTYRREDRYA